MDSLITTSVHFTSSTFTADSMELASARVSALHKIEIIKHINKQATLLKEHRESTRIVVSNPTSV
jgi:hypothetical protein